MTLNKPRAIVIGAGFGGLAAAIRLQAAGIPTTVFEKRDQAGGCASVFRDQGFIFDAGPTRLPAPSFLDDLFQAAGKRLAAYVTLLPVSPSFRLHWPDGFMLDFSDDDRALEAQIQMKSPRDLAGVRAFLAYARKAYETGTAPLADRAFLTAGSIVRMAPAWVRLSAYHSVQRLVSKFIRDPQLRDAFTFQVAFMGGDPVSCPSIHAASYYSERNGVFYPKGGTGALVRALTRLFAELGGDLRLNAPVERIVVLDGAVAGVQLQTGERFVSQAVVSDADAVHTYGTLLGHERRAERAAARLRAKSYSLSAFLIHFGVRKKYPQLAQHNVLFGLSDQELLGGWIYLHAPSVTDPTVSPSGSDAFTAMAPVANLHDAPTDWPTAGPRFADRILNVLQERCLPDLKRHLVTTRLFTPSDFKSELNAFRGAAFSLAPILRQSGPFRVRNRDARLPGLYFTGAGTHPGAGVAAVFHSAKTTARLVAEDLFPKQPPVEPALVRPTIPAQAGA